MKKLAKILALMLVLTMGVCMFTGCSDESKVEGVVEDFMDALADGDGDDAAEYCKGAELKGAARLGAMNCEGMEYEIKDVEVDGNEATVEVEITLDGDTDEDTIRLEKVDGDWMIVGL